MSSNTCLARSFAVGLVAVFAFAACGGDDESSSAPAAEAPAEESSADAGAAAAGSAAVTIADFAFSGPEEVSVGTTVVVTNNDSAPHTWTETNGLFASGNLGQGDSFEFTFDQAGTFEFFCEIHPSMTGSITVTG